MTRTLTSAAACAVILAGSAFGQTLAASFNLGPATGYVQVPHHDSLVPSGGFTVEAWVFQTGNAGGHRAVVRKNSAFLSESYNLRVTSNQPALVIKTQANGTVQLTPNAVLPQNSWHHLAGTFDNAVARLYLDGQLIGQTSSPLTGPLLNTGSTLKIGDGDGEPWLGHIDSVRIWSVARTQQQIQATMPYQVEDLPGLVASWHLDGTYQDSTGTFHGTQVGTVSFVPGAPLSSFLAAPAVSPVGAPLIFQINHQVPSLPYILDVSVTGTSPGITIVPGLVFPLNPPLLNFETGASLSNLFVNFFGFLDAAGHATPYIAVPPIPGLAGVTINASYLTIDLTSPTFIDYIAPPSQTVLGGLPLTISSVMPTVGVVAGGTSLTITGANFQPGAAVSIGTTAATGVVVTTSSSISCVTPAGTLGAKNVTVTNPDTISATLANGFAYVPPLAITNVIPLVAPSGTLITASGSGIQPGATVVVSGIGVAPTTITPTALSFTNPPGVPCNGSVQVVNPDAQMVSTAFNPFPTIGNILPSSGPAAGGNVVTIIGNNFWPGTSVTVGGNPASAAFIGTTLLNVTIPAGTAGPAIMVITSVNGCSANTNYTYL